ncbi:WD40-repeat-containing domain protein [Aspergillus varians]
MDSNSGHLLATLICGEIQLIDVNRAKVIRRFRGHYPSKFKIKSMFFGPKQALVLSGSEDSRIYMWDRDTGILVDILEGHESGCVNSLSQNPANPDMFVSSGDDGTSRIWVRKEAS